MADASLHDSTATEHTRPHWLDVLFTAAMDAADDPAMAAPDVPALDAPAMDAMDAADMPTMVAADVHALAPRCAPALDDMAAAFDAPADANMAAAPDDPALVAPAALTGDAFGGAAAEHASAEHPPQLNIKRSASDPS